MRFLTASCNECCQHEVRGRDLMDEQDGWGHWEDKWDVVQTEPENRLMTVAMLPDHNSLCTVPITSCACLFR